MMIMFAAEEAILIEIHPSYRQDRHFRHAARMTGRLVVILFYRYHPIISYRKNLHAYKVVEKRNLPWYVR